MASKEPNYRSPTFLDQHIRSTLAFYHPRCIDRQRGGFYQHFRDDGTIYDAHTRHLVSSTRFIFNYALAARRYGISEYLEAAAHGLRFLRKEHRNSVTGGYAWILDRDGVRDDTNHCYGFAFVLLAYACALRAGITVAEQHLRETFELMERRFWSRADQLYRDEISGDWQHVSPYRGQNANMHACEATLAAFEACGDACYLDRAHTLARRITCDLAGSAGGLIWEHYDEGWQPDWDYNRDNPKHLFRPWGFQSGHQTEWAKLLLTLEQHRPEAWMLPTARALFDRALDVAWDSDNGGICYGFDLEDHVCDDDKYFWVQAETFAAAARLAVRTGDQHYWDWYERIWDYAWHHFVDHRYGAWYRILNRNNQKHDDLKSPAGKTDYHTMGACYDVLSVLNDAVLRPEA